MSQKVCTSRKQILWWSMLNWFLFFWQTFFTLCINPHFLSLGLLVHLMNPICHFASELMVLNLLQTAVSPSPNQTSPFSPAGNKPGYPSGENLVRARKLWSLPAHPTSTGSNSEDGGTLIWVLAKVGSLLVPYLPHHVHRARCYPGRGWLIQR